MSSEIPNWLKAWARQHDKEIYPANIKNATPLVLPKEVIGKIASTPLVYSFESAGRGDIVQVYAGSRDMEWKLKKQKLPPFFVEEISLLYVRQVGEVTHFVYGDQGYVFLVGHDFPREIYDLAERLGFYSPFTMMDRFTKSKWSPYMIRPETEWFSVYVLKLRAVWDM